MFFEMLRDKRSKSSSFFLKFKKCVKSIASKLAKTLKYRVYHVSDSKDYSECFLLPTPHTVLFIILKKIIIKLWNALKGFINRLIHFVLSWFNLQLEYWSTRPTTVPAGSDHYFHTCCPSVHPIIRPSQNFKIKWISLLADTVGWPNGSLMTPVLFWLFYPPILFSISSILVCCLACFARGY